MLFSSLLFLYLFLPLTLLGYYLSPRPAKNYWLLLTSLLIWPRGTAQYRWALVLCLAWGTFVAASRVVLGAHYLSDVLFSTAFAFGVVGYAQRRTNGAPAQREGLDGEASPAGK